ncbi:MAG: DUF3667 domain-containing protein [Saprospiraceae bacterium]|nr:DUF3667 domain-containing protein [Saprospiraceae bacterium]MBK7736733.1 DUF3667 domain-containing protein [Saprospiraceae bacterium]MBK7911904.1 DUF3667 domain-containing protein [Saprospiraceae bacterium]
MSRKKLKQHACANCLFEFEAKGEHINYCPNCGQENHNPRFPLIHYAYELLESLIHFDSKFWYSFKVLLLHPGQISLDYINNIRGRYTPPVRLFIFISIFTFLIIGVFEKNLAKSGYFGSYADDAIKNNLTISEMFDQSADSIQDVILVAPFSWFMKNPQVTNADLRELKKTDSNRLADWLTKFGYSNNLITRFYAANKKLRISRNMTVPEVSIMVSSIFKWLFLIMIPINASILFVIFYKKGLLYYDTIIYSIHFSCFFLVFYSILLSEIMIFSSISVMLLKVLLILSLMVLIAFLFISLKKVFKFNWPTTAIRMLISCLLSFTIYQLVHYAISLNSGS